MKVGFIGKVAGGVGFFVVLFFYVSFFVTLVGCDFVIYFIIMIFVYLNE